MGIRWSTGDNLKYTFNLKVTCESLVAYVTSSVTTSKLTPLIGI